MGIGPEGEIELRDEAGQDRGIDGGAHFRAGVVGEFSVGSCWSERRCPRQRANQFHGLVARGTQRGRQRCGRRQRWLLPIQQREDAFPVVFAGCAQPAKGAHALESPRQDVLEKAVEETLRREAHRSSLAAAAVPVPEPMV